MRLISYHWDILIWRYITDVTNLTLLAWQWCPRSARWTLSDWWWHKANNLLLSCQVHRMYLHCIFTMILPSWKVTFVLYSQQQTCHTLQNQGVILVSAVGICVSLILKMQLPTSLDLFKINWPVCEAENMPVLKSNHHHVVWLYKSRTSSSP